MPINDIFLSLIMRRATISILILIITAVFFAPLASADWSEKAKMIKADADHHDLIVERRDGSRWLIQHSSLCRTMSTEFPVTLIWDKDELKELKVNFYERCKVYKAMPYEEEAVLSDLTRSDNLLVPDFQGEILWKDKKHAIEYSEGCPQFYTFLDKRIYLKIRGKGGSIVLPGARGQCEFRFAGEPIEVEKEIVEVPDALEGLTHQAQNNQVYFYWNPPKEGEKLLYAISYSRYEVNLEDYSSWREMPNVRITHRNMYTKRRLANRQAYHFYLAAIKNGVPGSWSHIEATPLSPGKVENKPDPDPFEIKMEETSDYFRLVWPYKEEAHRLFIRFYVDGKPQYFKVVKPENNEIQIPKKLEYLNKGLKLTVRTIPKPYQPRSFDGIYWEYKADDN